jgi:hypothetical protein
MMDFTTQQLTWIVIGACSLGGTGYISLNTKVDDMNLKVAVIQSQTDDIKAMLTRIENKLDKNSLKDK